MPQTSLYKHFLFFILIMFFPVFKNFESIPYVLLTCINTNEKVVISQNIKKYFFNE